METAPQIGTHNASASGKTTGEGNNSAHRWTPDVPMVVPELNPEHIKVIEAQRIIKYQKTMKN